MTNDRRAITKTGLAKVAADVVKSSALPPTTVVLS